MEREYVSRRTSPSPARRPVGRSGRNRRKKSGPPPIFILALVVILALIAAIVVLVVSLINGGKEKDNPPASSSQASSGLLSSSSATPVSSAPSSSSPTSSEPPAVSQKPPEGNPEQLGALLKIGDTGYEYYNFNEEAANDYITLISDAGKKLKGSATVYDFVIPTSMDIMLPNSYIEENNINSQDQRKAIEEYIYPSINAMNADVKTVSMFDALKQHSNEYIYFRTDHHWTQLGAYYAYAEFCKKKGIEAVALDQFEKKEYPGFLGSFYRDSPNDAMAGNPDTVEAYVPKANVSLYALQNDGTPLEDWPLIQDGDTYSEENKYLIFCAADQPYEEITNSDLTDGSSCLVVKESFGNVFIPFLVNHYQTVYVVDYREYQGNIIDLAKEKGVKDVLFVNNISMTRNQELVDTLSGKL